jgi:hypothetical protein
MIQRIGKYDMQYMKDPTHQYDIDDNQDKSEGRVQKNMLDSFSFSLP